MTTTKWLPVLLVIAACRPEAATPDSQTPGSSGPSSDATPATNATIGLSGHGGVAFGMDLAQANAALGEPLDAPATGCALVAPASAGASPSFQWMVVDGVLVRIDALTDAAIADGGGRIGMTSDELRTRYPDAVDEGPQKYDPEGRVWTVGAADATHFVFELDASGHVATWRVGRAPEVDWVERCG